MLTAVLRSVPNDSDVASDGAGSKHRHVAVIAVLLNLDAQYLGFLIFSCCNSDGIILGNYMSLESYKEPRSWLLFWFVPLMVLPKTWKQNEWGQGEPLRICPGTEREKTSPFRIAVLELT